jgi:HEAT repeat protein
MSQLDDLERIVRQLDEIKVPEPRQEMSERFYRMLEEEKSKIESRQFAVRSIRETVRSIFEPVQLSKLAYAAAILGIGMILGHWIIPDRQMRSQTALMMDEMQSMKKMMALTLFEQSQASDRLKAVSYTSEINEPDDKVIGALLYTLNYDPSTNVRLASLDELSRQVGKEEVRLGLVQAIVHQDSPLLQVAIAELMTQIEEKSAAPEFEKLLQRDDLNETVAEKLTECIKILT